MTKKLICSLLIAAAIIALGSGCSKKKTNQYDVDNDPKPDQDTVTDEDPTPVDDTDRSATTLKPTQTKLSALTPLNMPASFATNHAGSSPVHPAGAATELSTKATSSATTARATEHTTTATAAVRGSQEPAATQLQDRNSCTSPRRRGCRQYRRFPSSCLWEQEYSHG